MSTQIMSGSKKMMIAPCLVSLNHDSSKMRPFTLAVSSKCLKGLTHVILIVLPNSNRWQMTYKTSLGRHRIPRSLCVSLIGDFCLIGGPAYVALWTIDALMDSYSQ